jgi:peptidoglycan hydrolase CwlO-like protein
MALTDKPKDISHDVDELLADVQQLVRAHQTLQAENTQLRMLIAEQNQRFTHAQNRLLALAQQLPSLSLEQELPPDDELSDDE